MSVPSHLQAIVLGIVQGLTEFLPISSSAHLLLLPWLLGWNSMGLDFDVVLHGGSLLACLIYFRSYWKGIINETFRSIVRLSRTGAAPLPGALLVGTIPAALLGAVFRETIEQYLRTPGVTVFTLATFGLLLWRAESRGSQGRDLESIRIRDGWMVGLAQALALVPGVSRSGVTITAALCLGLSRAEAARFSFLLGTPLLAGMFMVELLELFLSQEKACGSVAAALVGILFAFGSGFLCIKYFLAFLQTRTCTPFVVYRLLLAACIFYLLVV